MPAALSVIWSSGETRNVEVGTETSMLSACSALLALA